MADVTLACRGFFSWHLRVSLCSRRLDGFQSTQWAVPMQMFLLSFPLWLLFVVFVLGSALLAVGVSWLMARHVPAKSGDKGLELAIFQTVGAVFGITLAFTISAVYGEFEAAASNVSEESNDIGILYRLAVELPEPQRSAFHQGLHGYVDKVIGQEWPLMAKGQSSREVGLALDRLWQFQHDLRDDKDRQVLAERLFQKLHDLTDRRRNRLLDSRSQLAPLMWMMLLGGGVVTVLFGAAIRSDNDRRQAVMVGAMAAVIGSGLLLVMALDCPFSGSMRVEPDWLRDINGLFMCWLE